MLEMMMEETKRRHYHANLIYDYFKRYESQFYDPKIVNDAGHKFVSHYMSLPDWDEQYNILIKGKCAFK